MDQFIFVGERPSQKALTIGATWQNGKLAGRTLRAALTAVGLDPAQQRYCNLFPGELPAEQAALITIQEAVTHGYTVVGMGQLVCQRLTAYGVAHRAMIHPAARGAIRRTDRYQAHVSAVLAEGQGR